MIKLFDGVYNRVIRDATLFKIVDDKTDPKRPVSFFRLAYFDCGLLCPNNFYFTASRGDAFIEIDNEHYNYLHILNAFDIIQARLEKRNIIDAIEKLS